MLFDFAIIGFGVIGVQTHLGIKNFLLKKKKKSKNKIRIAIVEKNLKNIPGGVAYSQINSKFGYFNNPLRLSHPEFIKWFNLKDNRERLIDFSNNKPSYNLNSWIKKNESILKKNYQNYKEIYLPRFIYSFYLKDKIIEFLNFEKKMNISIKFYQGDVKKIEDNDSYNIYPNKLFHEFGSTTKRKIVYIS